ncbi:AraC family transcriptional regulator [Propionivibrio soli]|uniref:AraC family transcriptional regulator n=1 Tax=Propionivibrio soli TaxID=2976531 RepID=UPI0021E79BEA|nr:AraC family transcriptional regulator [Propionivibrio soli]
MPPSHSIQVAPHTKEYRANEYRRRVCLAMNYISQHLDADVSLEAVAKAASLSMFHFHRIFKAVVGETVADYTRRLRLEWAANQLLAVRVEPVTVIAIECGFSSSQNFAKAFKLHFGVSPSAYRKSKTGNTERKRENVSLLVAGNNAGTGCLAQNNDERKTEVDAKIKEMPDYNVAYVRKIGPYGKEVCQRAFGELMQWAEPRGFLASGLTFAVYWDNPEVTPPERCRVDACVVVPPGTKPEGQIGIQTISGGRYAVCGFEITDDGFQQAWEDAFAWLVQSGYECDDKPCYEMYLNNAEQHPEGKWVVNACIPLKKL